MSLEEAAAQILGAGHGRRGEIRTRVQRDGEFVVLADVARVQRQLQGALGLRHALGGEPAVGLL